LRRFPVLVVFMKPTSLPNLLAFGLLLAGTANLHAETIFEASFDGPAYKDGSELPRGKGKIQHGRWGGDLEKGFSALVTDEKALSGSQSLVLNRVEASDDSVRPAKVWAGFGPDGSGNTRFTKSVSLSCAFLLNRTDGVGEGNVTFTLTGASASVLFAVEIGSDGSVGVRHRGSFGPVGKIVADCWYFLEIIGPDSEQSGGRPTINLYEAKGVERGKLIGSVEAANLPSNFAYAGFSLSNTLPESKVFFDDFQVITRE